MRVRGSFAFLAASLFASQLAFGQRSSNWRSYKLADGLPESACFSVSLAGQGKILAKHYNLNYLSKLDGYHLQVLPALEQTSSRVYASPAGQLWTVVSQGLEEFTETSWVLHSVPEIAEQFRSAAPNPIDPVPLYPVKQGQVLFLLPDRLMKLNLENPDQPQKELLLASSQSQLQKFSCMTPARNGGLWIGGTKGLAKAPGPARNLRPDTAWNEYLPPEPLGLQSFLELHEDEEGGLTALAMTKGEQRAIVHFDGQNWVVMPLGAEKVRHAWRGVDGGFWAATIDALLQWREGALRENEEVSARQYFDVAVEPNGIFWLATSEGLFRYAPPMWRSPLAVAEANSPVVHSLVSDGQARVWFLTSGTLHRWQEGEHQQFTLPAGSGNNQPARELFSLKNNNVLLRLGEEYLEFDPASSKFFPVQPAGSNVLFKTVGFLRDRTLCLECLEEGADGYRLGLFDGNRFRLFSDPLPDHAIGTKLSALYEAQDGDLWIGAEHGTAWYHENKWRIYVASDRSLPVGAVRFAELQDGKIWCATGDTIWEFDGKAWSAVRSGFDRISDMLRSRDGSVWVASNGGVQRYYQGAWVEQGTEEGLPSMGIRALCEDQHGRVWAATIRGVSVYHPEADTDPPRTRILEMSDREKNLPQGETLTIRFRGQDKWRYTPQDRLLYSFRLDDRDWSVLQEAPYATFPDLPAGKHYFQVHAMDRSFNVEPKAASVEFAIALPWYKEKRLILIALSGLGAALFFAGLAFNRHRQLLRSYTQVERKVAERTHELELANRELLHSQKMNALGTLAAGIAHDFNNILSIIKGSAQIIEDNVDQPQKILTRTDRIKTVVEQGAGIVKAMLGFSRDSDRSSSVCDINVVVEDTLRLLGDRFLREVEVRFEPAADLPPVLCARDFLQQILLNFIFNAAEAMNSRRQIIVSTGRRRDLPPEVVLKPAATDDFLVVAVRDFGCGIPPENRARIFEPFFTTKALSARRGTGLGLSMAYQLASKMEAGLAVESTLNQGSTFTVILPVREAESNREENQTA